MIFFSLECMTITVDASSRHNRFAGIRCLQEGIWILKILGVWENGDLCFLLILVDWMYA